MNEAKQKYGQLIHSPISTNNYATVNYADNQGSVGLYKTTDTTNCKLDFINGIGALSHVRKNVDKKYVLDSFLINSKGTVFLNTTNKNVAEWIRDNYPTYYFHEVPIGYQNSFQYHLCIKNTVNINNYCREPKEKKEEVNESFLNKIELKLRSILKSKRRKDDYVDELINSLKSIG